MAAWTPKKTPPPPNHPMGTTAYFEDLFGYEWERTKSPAGRSKWKAQGTGGGGKTVLTSDPTKHQAR